MTVTSKGGMNETKLAGLGRRPTATVPSLGECRIALWVDEDGMLCSYMPAVDHPYLNWTHAARTGRRPHSRPS